MQTIILAKNRLEEDIDRFIKDMNSISEDDYINMLLSLNSGSGGKYTLCYKFQYKPKESEDIKMSMFLAVGDSEIYLIRKESYYPEDDILHDILWNTKQRELILDYGVELDIRPYLELV